MRDASRQHEARCSYLDATPYRTETIYRAELRVARDRKAHCFDGACFAAAMLMRLGHPPLSVDMRQVDFAGLRYREPVYQDVRELLMSYFEPFLNLAKNRTLRGYTRPLSLKRFARHDWMLRGQTMS